MNKINCMTKTLIISSIFLLITKGLYNFVDVNLSSKSDFVIRGIDISHHNQIYNWQGIKSNSKFCIIKATEGSTFRDPKFNTNWVNSKNHKITRGAYHFFKPGISAKKQFENFKNKVKLEKGDLPPVLDVELKEADMNQVNEWLRLAENHYGVKPIVYSDYLFFKIFMDGKLNNSYPLWLHLKDDYGFKPSFNNYDCIIWQYDQKGKMQGIKGDVDLNTFLGDSESFKNILVK